MANYIDANSRASAHTLAGRWRRQLLRPMRFLSCDFVLGLVAILASLLMLNKLVAVRHDPMRNFLLILLRLLAGDQIELVRCQRK